VSDEPTATATTPSSVRGVYVGVFAPTGDTGN
jgi:hypothetical protein